MFGFFMNAGWASALLMCLLLLLLLLVACCIASASARYGRAVRCGWNVVPQVRRPDLEIFQFLNCLTLLGV
jgi:hypothetical protein